MTKEGFDSPSFERSPLQLKDPVLREKLAHLELPPTMQSFARYSQGGLHLIGVESKQARVAPVLVALPGIGHANWSYIDLVRSLGREGVEMTALSFPGDGESRAFDKNPDELKVADYVRNVKSFLQELKKPVILTGHSFGGLIAQRIAADEDLRDIVKGLVLINSVPPTDLRGRSRVIEGSVFLPRENPEWKESLFSPAEEKDKTWWFEELDKASVQTAVMKDYSVQSDGGRIEPSAINIPILELSGSNDLNALTNLRSRSSEVTEMFDEGEGPRTSITDFYKKAGGHSAETTRFEMIEGAPHDMILGHFADAVSESIRKSFYR